MSSPAERYAAARERQAREGSAAGQFAESLGFELDEFQRTAIDAVAAGEGVLVAAPTGAGKTVVGEFAVAEALRTGRKAFYTTPIKALSNQKYHDLLARHGRANVGLLTGDSTVNGEAPVVVMTTEVLRNMLYAGSSTLAGLGYVVMDEVHYLADRFRGAVWEEVIIHLPEHVQVISLSATVSNAEEFGDWLRAVRGNTAVVVSEDRPVPLWQHMVLDDDLFDLFVDTAGTAARSGADSVGVNPDLLQRLRTMERRRGDRWSRGDVGSPRGRHGRVRHAPVDDGPTRGGRPPSGGRASRPDVIRRLEREGLLPAIDFIFSRKGCEEAVQQLIARDVRLIDERTGRQNRHLVETRVAEVADADLSVLGFWDFVDGISRGFAAHHAGMLPLFREVVEELFTRGRIQVVFATETLALGVNMPARTVLLESLRKFNGESLAHITAAEYTQLTGRAGRRGIDVEGHAVVQYRRGMDPEAVAGLASARTYPLRSSFRPTSNMAVNLVRSVGEHTAIEILQSSFAQFQADRSVVDLARQVRRNEEALDGYTDAMTCERGDAAEYVRLRRRLSDVEKKASRERSRSRRAEIALSLDALSPGDVVVVEGGRRDGLGVAIRPRHAGQAKSGSTTVLTEHAQVRRIDPVDLREPLRPVGTLPLPKGFDVRSARSRKDLAALLRARYQHAEARDAAPPHEGERGEVGPTAAREAVRSLQDQLRAHPVNTCPDREDHVRWGTRWWKLRSQTDDLTRRVGERTNTMVRTFERICALLVDLGYLTREGEDDDGALEVTADGRRLQRLYTEKDLLAAECLRHGLWDGLTPAELAGAVSILVHENRGDEPTLDPRMPTRRLAETYERMLRLWGQLQDRETEHRLPLTPQPDGGLADPVHRWADGRNLADVLRHADLTAGDFVRRCKQVVDLLGQITQAGDPALADVARAASDAMLRGVVAADRLD